MSEFQSWSLTVPLHIAGLPGTFGSERAISGTQPPVWPEMIAFSSAPVATPEPLPLALALEGVVDHDPGAPRESAPWYAHCGCEGEEDEGRASE
jgi:hypothetical protein